jgi:hypothetical protein
MSYLFSVWNEQTTSKSKPRKWLQINEEVCLAKVSDEQNKSIPTFLYVNQLKHAFIYNHNISVSSHFDLICLSLPLHFLLYIENCPTETMILLKDPSNNKTAK